MKKMPALPISESGSAILSAEATAVLRAGGEEAYGTLVVTRGGNGPLARLVGGLSPEKLFAKPVKHKDDAAAALAGLWLWVDALESLVRIAELGQIAALALRPKDRT